MTLLLALLLSADPATSHQVSIPLDDYEKLRKQSERPALTVVDLLRVEGSFARRDLAVTLAGRASGSWPTAEVLQADGVRLHSCQGEALLSRAGSGAFAVTPLAQKFSLRCKVALDGSDRLAAQATAAVLEVESAVSDGELVASGGGGDRSFSVVRRIAGSGQQDLPPTVTGRYLVTLLPDEARFEYRLEVRNPARGHRRYEVALREAEHVEGVDAQVVWDAEGGKYRFDLPPGDTVLVLRGRLAEPRFVPPVAASLQYLLLQSHPLIRPDLKTEARRVGVGETGLAASFRGAQAFLLDAGAATEVAWTATRLEALKTAGLAISRLDQVWFLGADGKARGEASLSLDNQGAPALTLPGTKDPTYASVGGEPAFLTHDKEGNLFLPLAQGPQEVVVQDVHPFSHRLGFGLARLELPRAPVPASHAAVQLRYPAEWLPVYEELPPQSRWHLLDLHELATILLVMAAAERLLAFGGVAARRRWLLAVSLGLAGAFLPDLRVGALFVLVLAWIAVGIALVALRLRGAPRVLALVGGAATALLVLAIWGGSAALRQPPGEDARSYAASNLMGKAKSDEFVPRRQAVTMDEAAEEPPMAVPPSPAQGGGGIQSYEGLPAKIEIPPGARQSSFGRELLATDVPRPVVALVVSARFVSTLSALAVLLFLALAVLFRRSLAAGAVALAGKVRPAGPPPLTTGA